MLDLLIAEGGEQDWWLGYLDTGAHDVVFPFAARTIPFYGHGYVLIQAGPQQAGTWRETGWNWALPDLMFPTGHAWMLSTGWDNEWTTVAGSERLIAALENDSILGPRTSRQKPMGPDR